MEYLQINTGNSVHRRVFIKGIGYVSLSLLLGTFGGCEELAEAIRNRPTRRRLRTGSSAVDADIATYREAVRLMKQLSITNPADPRGWQKQAQIHGTEAGGFNLCQHGTDHFFSWHRAYLFYFEKICQKLTNNKNFGLPYWNWNRNNAIHSAFLDTTSPLFNPRDNTTMAGHSSISNATLNTIFSDTNFFSFGPQIEGTPHNTTHTGIGGLFGTGGSAGDPIFWAHHCMVDYCWAKWNIEMGRNNPNDPAWNNVGWNHFFDADGNPAHTTAGLTTIMPLLSYQYESSVIGGISVTDAIRNKKEFEKLEKRIREGADIKFVIRRRIPIAEKTMVTIARPFSKQTTEAPGEFVRIIDNKEKETIFLSIEYAQLPSTSDFFIRVFINKPDADSKTSTDDPHFAGSFAFFGTEPATVSPGDHGAHHQPRFLVNVVPALQKLRASGEIKDGTNISVQLVAVPFGQQFEKMDTQVMLNNIELIVTPVIVPSGDK